MIAGGLVVTGLLVGILVVLSSARGRIVERNQRTRPAPREVWRVTLSRGGRVVLRSSARTAAAAARLLSSGASATSPGPIASPPGPSGRGASPAPPQATLASR